MNIDLTLIDPPLRPVRRANDAEADAALESSVRILGVLTPVLLAQRGDRYATIAGDRRVRAARAVGLTIIPAVIAFRGDEMFAQAAATAENMVRLGMPPVDQWRAIRSMQDLGFSLPDAAGSLGMSERQARRLTRLGDLHPNVLELIECVGMPTNHELARIAMADPLQQAKALRAPGAVERDDDDGLGHVSWWKIAQACATGRISRAVAIFDVDASSVAFEEDLFASPGSADQWTTSDVDGFLAAQRTTLEAKAAKGKYRLEFVPLKNGTPDVPKGFRTIDAGEGKRFAKKHEVQFASVIDAGHYIGKVQTVWAVDIKAEKEAAKAAEAVAKAKTKVATSETPASTAADDHVADAGQMIDSAEPPAPDADPAARRFTKSGLQLIADMKTAALRATLRDCDMMHLDTLCAALVLTLFADNVSITGYAPAEPGLQWQHGRDLCERLVTPTGHLIADQAEIMAVACEAIARALHVTGPARSGPDSGANAELIGKALHAEEHFDRFDTAALLAEATGDTLREIASTFAVPTKGRSVAQLREALTDQLPSWMPHEAVFHADILPTITPPNEAE